MECINFIKKISRIGLTNVQPCGIINLTKGKEIKEMKPLIILGILTIILSLLTFLWAGGVI